MVVKGVSSCARSVMALSAGFSLGACHFEHTVTLSRPLLNDSQLIFRKSRCFPQRAVIIWPSSAI